MSPTWASEYPLRESTPALSDDTGSSSSRESFPPATPTSGVSRAPSISFDDYSKHTHAGEGTDIRIVEADTLPEDITRSLKRKRLGDTRTDGVRAERALPPDIWGDATRADDGTSFGLCHIPISDCTSVGDVEPDALHPSLEYVSRPLKRNRSANTSTYDVRAKRARTSGTSNDATKAEDRACFSLGHIPNHDYTKIRVVEPDADPPVAHGIDIHVPLEAIARPPKRKRCADTTVDEVCGKRRRLSDSPSDASKPKDGGPYGPHPRCMITGCVSADVEGCYIWPLDMPQRLFDNLMSRMRGNYNTLRCHAPRNIIFLRRDLRELWETNCLLMIPHPDHLKSLDCCTVYKYCVIAEDEHPPDSCATMGNPITPSVMMAPCSYRSLGWHELKADLRLMVFRAGQKLSKRPFHYQHILRELLPHNEVNHTYSIVSRYKLWTGPLQLGIVHGRRLWATGELAPFPDGYFRYIRKQYCPPLSYDDAVRFPRPFRRIVSGIKRKRSGDTRAHNEVYTAEEDAQCETRGRWGRLRNLRAQSCSLIDRRKPAMC
ncbi:hypothetical protein IEO21_08916 [Rhodonia placenta]|uniref:HNH nuclease domain-containing protein n=1 Tax=Rhodonia placenta TaxID=104341 RepID=A0A8H7NVC4_9APHY|nr:hypothetical protein IEO21_08916 [Postia placenta]